VGGRGLSWLDAALGAQIGRIRRDRGSRLSAHSRRRLPSGSAGDLLDAGGGVLAGSSVLAGFRVRRCRECVRSGVATRPRLVKRRSWATRPPQRARPP